MAEMNVPDGVVVRACPRRTVPDLNRELFAAVRACLHVSESDERKAPWTHNENTFALLGHFAFETASKQIRWSEEYLIVSTNPSFSWSLAVFTCRKLSQCGLSKAWLLSAGVPAC
jgi:hypothetical protein